MSFYATLFGGTLSADSLETFLKKDTTLRATLLQNGVTLVEVSRPDTAPQSQNSVVVILGVLLGAAGAVILIACIVIAG